MVRARVSTTSSIGGRQGAREGVLLADVIRAEDRGLSTIGCGRHVDLEAVREARPRSHAEIGGQHLIRELPQRQQHPRLVEQRELALQERPAPVAFSGCRLVRRRRASHRRGDVRAVQTQTVIDRDTGGLIGEAGPPQGCVQEVATAIAGEHAAGAIRPVRGRRQAHEHYTRRRVTEAWNGSRPVLLVAKRGPFLPPDLLPPVDQTRTRPTRDRPRW